MLLEKIKALVKKIIWKNYYSNEAYIRFLRCGGAKIGKGTFFYVPSKRPIDESSLPYIEIGEYCRITEGVKILAHDYSYAVLRRVYHCMPLKVGVTRIGDNVFIGMNAIICMGVSVGSNVVIGAGSVVTHDVPSNTVVAGNPAHTVGTLEDYYNRCINRFEENAKIFMQRESAYKGRSLEENEMGWFLSLWDSEFKEEYLSNSKVDGDEVSEVVNDVCNIKPKYKSFEEFKRIIDGE